MLRRTVLFFLFLLLASWPVAAGALEIELGVKSGGAFITNDRVTGGGAGLGVSLSLPLWQPFDSATLGVAADTQLLFGFGPTVAISAGPYLRFSVGGLWTPELGLRFQYLGGALIRTGDEDGNLPGDPVAVQLGASPLRFVSRSSKAWVSFLDTRYGWTFQEAGSSIALTVSVIEVGRSF